MLISIDGMIWRSDCFRSLRVFLFLFSLAFLLFFFPAASALDTKVLGVNSTELKDDAKKKGAEMGWAAAGGAYRGLADSLNGAGDVRSEPVVANEQLPPPPTSGCKPSPQPINFRVSFEIGSQSLKRLATAEGMNQMIPPAAAGTESSVSDRLKENYGNQMFSTLASAVPDVGIGFVVGTFKGSDLLGSNSLSNSNNDLFGARRTRSVGRSVAELIEDAYQKKDPELSSLGEMIHRNENGKFIFGDERTVKEQIGSHHPHADSLQNGGLSVEKKASLLRAYDALLDKSGTDIELKDSMTRGVRAFNWPRVIPNEHADVITNEHHQFTPFIQTMRNIIQETDPGAFVLDGASLGGNSSTWTNNYFHTKDAQSTNNPLNYFATNGLSDLNCNTIPFHPDGNYFVTAIFASIPTLGDFKFCFALNTCDQMAAIAFTPAPLSTLVPEPLASIVATVEDLSVAVSLKSNLSMTFVPFWQGEERSQYAAKMRGTLAFYISITPELSFLKELKELFELNIKGIAMVDLDPNRDGGVVSFIEELFTKPSRNQTSPNQMFKKLMTALTQQKDIAIGIKIQGSLAFKLSKVTKGILPDLLLKASAQLMLAANVQESDSLYNGLYIRAHIDATSIVNFVQTLANLFTIGGKQEQVNTIMEQVRNNLVAQLDVFARGSDASWGFRFTFGTVFKLYLEFTDGSSIKLCANSACIVIPLISCAKYSIGRGVGTPMTVCGEGEEKEGALCYKKCDSGYRRIASTCWQQCDASYTDMGVFCDTGEVGTPISECNGGREKIGLLCYEPCSNGWNKEGIACTQPCKSGYIDDGLTCRRPPNTVTADNSGCPWYDKCGLVWKSAKGCTKCPEGYRNDGCVCSIDMHIETQPRKERRSYPLSCPSSKKESDGLCYHTLPKSYTKSSYTTRTLPLKCEAGKDQEAGLCYKKCDAGLTGIGPVCWGGCPSSYPHDAGAICCKSASKCFIPIIGCSKKNDRTGANNIDD